MKTKYDHLRPFILFLVLITSFYINLGARGNSSETLTIVQHPTGSEIVVGTPINVTLISNDTDIEGVSLIYCSFEPEYSCHLPPERLTKNDGRYSAIFTPEYEVGTIMGYHLLVRFKNGSSISIPNENSFQNQPNIRQGDDDVFYFELTLIETQTSTTQVSLGSGLGFVCILILSFNQMSKRRKR